MKKIYKLSNQIKHYEWGSPSFIPRLLNIENDGNEPYAEMWMGTHKSAPSKVIDNGNAVNLEDIAGELPFLFKLIAVEKPLSIQVHPNKQQAMEGYERENKAGIPIDAPSRNYKDPNKKSEIICAVTPFTLMAGFKEPEMIIASLGDFSPEQEKLIKNLESQYPNDGAIYAPLYFNIVTLEPFQAVYIPCGVPHSYISGFGIELMDSSDNVLRGGLTGKHVDIDELMKILKPDPFLPEVITPDSNSRFYYPCSGTIGDDFSLSLIRGRAQTLEINQTENAICVVTEGELNIDNMSFKKGESFFISGGESQLKLEGTFSLFTASQTSKSKPE